MTDILTPGKRSWNMSRIRDKNTKPEKIVRSALHRMGFRFSLHRKDLSGKPDIVLPKHRTVVFVHGCFWHRHKNCKYAYTPKSSINPGILFRYDTRETQNPVRIGSVTILTCHGN
ncbi:MAG: hypothetical protein Q7J98_03160 [Kiritimatiellia bacterium]|nr:hypothetical protein [Kiritimatiellia bacterium]